MVSLHDLFLVLFLIFLEGVLSIDNALVLALIARGLPDHQQKKALLYGFGGAIVFRFLSLFIITRLIQWTWVKYLGGAYLIYVSVKYLLRGEKKRKAPRTAADHFWRTVVIIEFTDIAFAVDSILAAVALSNKLWIVFTAAIIGTLLMRYAALLFIQLLRRFPHLEKTAYLLVGLIGIKVILEALRLRNVSFHSSHDPANWVFWGLMALSVIYGFIPSRSRSSGREPL